MTKKRHLVGCPKEADPRNKLCCCAEIEDRQDALDAQVPHKCVLSVLCGKRSGIIIDVVADTDWGPVSVLDELRTLLLTPSDHK